MATPQRVGLITTADGAHVTAYLQALAASELCGQVALADPDARWNDDAQRRLGDKLTASFATADQLLAEFRPDLALITLEARHAPPVIRTALEHDCHVFAEKPACVRVDDFARLVDEADRKHRYLMLALANRLNPEVAAARRMIRDGRLGDPYGIEMHLVADQTRLSRASYQSSWFADRSRAGGGHLLWLGIHWLDLAMYLLDSPIVEANGFLANVGGQPIQVEDSAAASFRMQNGILGTMTSGYYLDRGYHSHLKIWGSRGWLHLDSMHSQPLSWYINGETEDQRSPDLWEGDREPRGYSPVVHAALRACSEMTDPPISTSDSHRALRTVFGIYGAAANRTTVTIDV